MNILFKCFECEKEAKTVIHSYNWNKKKESFEIKELCKHFSNIELNWETKYGFFTLGWSVKIYNVSLECKRENCNKRITFASQTFNKNNNYYEEIQECCDTIIVYSAREGYFDCSDEGRRRQKDIKFINELKAAEEENKKLKEEQEQLENKSNQKKKKNYGNKKKKKKEEKGKKKKKNKKKKNKEEEINMNKKIKKCLKLKNSKKKKIKN